MFFTTVWKKYGRRQNSATRNFWFLIFTLIDFWTLVFWDAIFEKKTLTAKFGFSDNQQTGLWVFLTKKGRVIKANLHIIYFATRIIRPKVLHTVYDGFRVVVNI